jgi:hypothetical protein
VKASLIALTVVIVCAVVVLLQARHHDRGASADASGGARSSVPVGGDRPGARRPVPGTFAGIIKPGGAKPLSNTIRDGNDVTQAFLVDGLEPADVMAFYEENLTGWDTAGPAPLGACSNGVDPSGFECSWSGVRTNGGSRLEIAATPDNVDADNLGNGSDVNLLLTGAGT